MKFSFDKSFFENLDKCSDYEWLTYNESGAYSHSSIVGMNTRRSHGLLNVPYGESNRTAVVLSKLEESVFINNQLSEISTNQYSDVSFPHGYQFIEEFTSYPFPTTSFNISGRRLKKTIILLKDRNVLIVRYELLNQGDPVKLIIKPFLAVRDVADLTAEVQGFNTDSYLGQNFVRWAPKPDMPELNVHFNQGEFIPASLWYHNFYYTKDTLSSEPSLEDLLNPGFFRVELKPYQSLDLYLSPENLEDFNFDYESIYRSQAESNNGEQEDEIIPQLQNGFNRIVSSKTKLFPAGVTNSIPYTRNLLFVLPAIMTVLNDKSRFLDVFNALISSLEKGMLPQKAPSTDTKPVYEDADTPLWLINTAYAYYRETEDETIFSEQILENFRSIILAYTKGTFANIYSDKAGLIFSGNKETNSSWFPLFDKENNVFRYGYLLEINALWYNALKIMESIHHLINKKRQANKYLKQAEQVRKSFADKFVNDEKGTFFDFIGHHLVSEDIRLNQIIPLVLPFSVIESAFAKRVFSKIDEELATPFGLRLLGKKQNKNKIPEADSISRMNAIYFDSAIWPWTINLYVKAALKYKVDNPDIKQDLIKYYSPVFELVENGLLGHFPEAIYLDDTIRQFGIQDCLLSLSNVLLAIDQLEK